MKSIIVAIAILFGASTATFAQAVKTTTHKNQHTKMAKKYTCSMHPEVVKNKPGKCPKCGMKLIPMTSKNQLQPQRLNQNRRVIYRMDKPVKYQHLYPGM